MSGRVWLVAHPTFIYNEDVSALAAASGLEVVDERFADQYDPVSIAKDPPKLTKQGDKPAPKAKAKD